MKPPKTEQEIDARMTPDQCLPANHTRKCGEGQMGYRVNGPEVPENNREIQWEQMYLQSAVGDLR